MTEKTATIGLRIPATLKRRIEAEARKENRTVNNYIETQLIKIIEREAKDKAR